LMISRGHAVDGMKLADRSVPMKEIAATQA